VSDLQPSRNIELKARCRDLGAARKTARSAGAEFAWVAHQHDTYFRCPDGRLKLRRIDSSGGRRAELIRYRRADVGGPRLSRYRVRPVRLPRLLGWWLALRHGIVAEVSKRRELWLWRGVRIHLDEVEKLGTFVELEAVVGDIGSEPEADRRCREMAGRLGIEDADVIEVSYSDML